LSLALIGNASVVKSGMKPGARAEAFSIRRLEGSRWRLRRTLAMGIGWRFGTRVSVLAPLIAMKPAGETALQRWETMRCASP
jgi:hypothetical protein